MRARVSIRGGLAPRSTRAIADCVVPQSSANSRCETPQAFRRSATRSAIRPNSSRSLGSAAPRAASRRDASLPSSRLEDLGPCSAIARLLCIAGLLCILRGDSADGPAVAALLPSTSTQPFVEQRRSSDRNAEMVGRRKDSGILRGGVHTCRSHVWVLAAIALWIFMVAVIVSGIGKDNSVRVIVGLVITVGARAIYKGSRRRPPA
jgi:hypothetical protein